jgi:hypothetical protein
MFTTNQALELSPYDVTSADNPNDPAHHNRVLRTSESKIKDHRFMVSFTGYF